MGLNYIDLFAGAGGLSEGFIRAGFKPIAHVEMNKDACDTLKTRSVYHYLLANNRISDYQKYLKGEITRNEYWSLVPDNVIEPIINKEISNHTLDSIFQIIDSRLINEKFDVVIRGKPCKSYLPNFKCSFCISHSHLTL